MMKPVGVFWEAGMFVLVRAAAYPTLFIDLVSHHVLPGSPTVVAGMVITEPNRSNRRRWRPDDHG